MKFIKTLTPIAAVIVCLQSLPQPVVASTAPFGTPEVFVPDPTPPPVITNSSGTR
jgi:hypothetical protein